MAFYDLPESERIALTNRVIAERRSLMERWDALNSSEAAPWIDRAARAAELLADAHGVLDLGCGTCALERHLASGAPYWPCDITKRDDRTIICDLN